MESATLAIKESQASSLGRFVWAFLLFLIGSLGLLALLMGAAYDHEIAQEQSALRERGSQTVGQITEVLGGYGRASPFRCEFTFSTVAAPYTRLSVRETLNEKEWLNLRAGQPVIVLYDTSSPNVARIDFHDGSALGQEGHDNGLVLLMIAGLVAVAMTVGIVMIFRWPLR